MVIVLVIVLSIFISSCGNSKTSNYEVSNNPTEQQQEMLDSGWTFDTPEEGEFPEIYGVQAEYGTKDNYLDITMGTDYDLVVKIIDCRTKSCVRYIYIPNNTTTTIQDIPQGQYFFKFSYGNDWMSLATENSIKGKFTQNVMYEKGRTIFDFGKKNSETNVSYKLEIKVKDHILTKSFETDVISEKEFSED